MRLLRAVCLLHWHNVALSHGLKTPSRMPYTQLHHDTETDAAVADHELPFAAHPHGYVASCRHHYISDQWHAWP